MISHVVTHAVPELPPSLTGLSVVKNKQWGCLHWLLIRWHLNTLWFLPSRLASRCLWARHGAQIDPTMRAWHVSVHISVGLHTCKFSMNATVFCIAAAFSFSWIQHYFPVCVCGPALPHHGQKTLRRSHNPSQMALVVPLSVSSVLWTKLCVKVLGSPVFFRGIVLSSSWISCTTPWE